MAPRDSTVTTEPQGQTVCVAGSLVGRCRCVFRLDPRHTRSGEAGDARAAARRLRGRSESETVEFRNLRRFHRVLSHHTALFHGNANRSVACCVDSALTWMHLVHYLRCFNVMRFLMVWPHAGFPSNWVSAHGVKKLDWWGYRAEQEVSRYFQPSGYNPPTRRAPCGLRGCKNWPAPFPGRMYKARSSFCFIS